MRAPNVREADLVPDILSGDGHLLAFIEPGLGRCLPYGLAVVEFDFPGALNYGAKGSAL